MVISPPAADMCDNMRPVGQPYMAFLVLGGAEVRVIPLFITTRLITEG